MEVVSSLLLDLAKRVCAQATQLCEIYPPRLTMRSVDIQTSIRMVLGGELRDHAIAEGTKAVVKFCADKANREPGHARSQSSRAGLTFPVSFFKKLLLKSGLRVGNTAGVYLASCMEYIAAEVLELAGNASRDNMRVRIIPRHIMLALRNDKELNELFPGHIASGGVLPNIHPALLP